MRRRWRLAVFLALSLALAGCGRGSLDRSVTIPEVGGSPLPSATPTGTIEPRAGLPDAVQETRAGILMAAEIGDYELLRPWLRPEVFLSEWGFGVEDEPDPIGRWEGRGPEALATMAALLRMRFAESNSNEGRLYRWPTYGPETSSLEEVTRCDRELFLTVMTEKEFGHLVGFEIGYMGPRIGILEDGTWSFFVPEGA